MIRKTLLSDDMFRPRTWQCLPMTIAGAVDMLSCGMVRPEWVTPVAMLAECTVVRKLVLPMLLVPVN